MGEQITHTLNVHTADHSAVKQALGIPEDEPYFVIRGKDKAAIPALEDYATHAEIEGASETFVGQVYERIDEFRRFRWDNPDAVSYPTLPNEVRAQPTTEIVGGTPKEEEN